MGIYEPFEYRLNNISQFFTLIAFATIAFFTSLLFFILIPSWWKSLYHTDRWNIGYQTLHCFIFLLFTATFIFLYDYHYLCNHTWEYYLQDEHFLKHFSTDFLSVFSIGAVPLCIGILIDRNYKLKEHLNDAETLSRELQKDKEKNNVPACNTVLLTGDTKDSLNIQPSLIRYIESAGNYVHIYYNENGLNKKTIRTTIRQLEEELRDCPQIIRCHRAYIVNTQAILHIEGNAQGYKLTLNDCPEQIPVSRTYIKAIKTALEA